MPSHLKVTRIKYFLWHLRVIQYKHGIISYFASECNPPFSMLPTGCYYYSSTRVSWENARDDCLSYGADLAIIKSAEEQDVLQDYLEDVADAGTNKISAFHNQRIWHYGHNAISSCMLSLDRGVQELSNSMISLTL